MTRLGCSILLGCAAILAGCVVGPNYKGPPDVAGGATQFHRNEVGAAGELTARWWTALGDEQLDGLMDAALGASPDREISRARILEARAGLASSRADRLPTTGVSAAYLRAKGLGGLTGGAGGSAALESYSTNFDAIWEADLFGGKARAVENAKAQAAAAEAALDGVTVSLEAEVAQAYVMLRQMQQRSALTQRSVDLEAEMLDLERRRRAGGLATDLDVERLNIQLRTTQAELAPLAARIAEQLDRLAILTGRPPGALDADLNAPAEIPRPPTTMAVGDPAGLLRRRPDIRQAERQLAASNAVIGERVADLFPKVTLVGALGYAAPEFSQVFNSSQQTNITAGLIQWTPFDFGRTQAHIAQAKGSYAEAVGQYRKTVLAALQDAETSLVRYARQRESAAQLREVAAASEHAAGLQAIRREGGTATTIDVLDTERQRLASQLNVVDADALLTSDFIALQKSIGLGWDVEAR